MVFDLGYGNQGGGLHYRPSIDIKYTIPSAQLSIELSNAMTISEDSITSNRLACGFDKEDKIITEAWIEIYNTSTVKKHMDIRYNVEFVDFDEISYSDIKDRESIEYIGYEVSSHELGRKKCHNFAFDNYSKLALEDMHEQNKEAKFIIRPTTVLSREHLIDWAYKGKEGAKLIINYIRKRKKPISSPVNIKTSIEKGTVKISWDKIDDEDCVGYYVVRNRWHPPKNPFDGVKLYAGADTFTYDTFGSTKIDKYYTVFSYDDVPNYSQGSVVEYKGQI
ncbi:Carboxypeptidase A1 precursor [hydrothermal vent metagenome]|uniref:Carboxypeptidase A1 n=1 Tax=hydrothermal vent metagenome TaxID=652676 RepID=A0A1W1BAY3_9ZZZZ